VQFTGEVRDADRNALLTLARGFVFPSHLRAEAFGVALVEAAMFAKPMISCEIGTGTSYINLDGETGFVVPPQDPAALRQAMQQLHANAADAAAMGARARARYEALFTGERMVGRYLELYETLLRSRQ
jgi:rhamnosyl/mannosyltransferase